MVVVHKAETGTLVADESNGGFRGVALGMPGATLSSADPRVLGAPLDPANLRAGATPLVDASLGREAASLEAARTALTSVREHFQTGLETTTKIGDISRSVDEQPKLSLPELTKAITEAAELRNKLDVDTGAKFNLALLAASRGEEPKYALAEARRSFESLTDHSDSYLKVLRLNGENRMSAETISAEAQQTIYTSLTQLEGALRAVGIKTDHEANKKRFAQLSERLSGCIDESNGLLQADSVQAVRDEFSAYFEVAGARSKGWTVFREQMDRLAESAQAATNEYAVAKEALRSIGGSPRIQLVNDPRFPIWAVGGYENGVAPSFSAANLEDLGISTKTPEPLTLADMNGLFRRAELRSRGEPEPAADFREDDRTPDMESLPLTTSKPEILFTNGDVSMSVTESRRGEELVGREIELKNNKLSTSIKLYTDYDYKDRNETVGSRHRNAEFREHLRARGEEAFQKFRQELGDASVLDSEKLEKVMSALTTPLRGGMSSGVYVESRPEESWENRQFIVRTSKPEESGPEALAKHLAKFAEGKVSYQVETRASRQANSGGFESLKLEVDSVGIATVTLSVKQAADRSGTLTVRMGGLMRDDNDVSNNLTNFREYLGQDNDPRELMKMLVEMKVVEAKNITLGSLPERLKLRLSEDAALTNVTVLGSTVEIESGYRLPETRAELRKNGEYDTQINGLRIKAAKVKVNLMDAAITALEVDGGAITKGSFDRCYFERCSIEGKDTSISFKGKTQLSGCERSAFGFGSRIIKYK